MTDITLGFLARQNERIIAELRHVREQTDAIRGDLLEVKERLGSWRPAMRPCRGASISSTAASSASSADSG